MPGLVNCHTHLELTHLGGGQRHHEPEFVSWIRRIRELKDATSPEAFYAAAIAGVQDCWSRGITCIAETGSSGAVMRALHDLGGRGVVYQEVFGPDPAKSGASMVELRTAIETLRPLQSDRLRLGVSPHAPYTVSAPLYRAVGEYARMEALPLAVHVAESQAERLLVYNGTGPFADALRGRGIAIEAQGISPISYLLRCGVLHHDVLCIHCVQADEADIELLRVAGAAVALCPRSNAAHGHGRAPIETLRHAHIRVGIGTDSVVSVGELDLWAEAEAAGCTGTEALRMLTIEGARALSWDSEIGSLEVGKSADLAVLLDEHPRRPAVLTMICGRIVHLAAGFPAAR
jgi:5-methylthioadenosine/S-adenosylhomocysteine deaminase